MKLYQSLTTRDFAAGDLIDLTAAVKVEADGASNLFFISPKLGGSTVKYKVVKVW